MKQTQKNQARSCARRRLLGNVLGSALVLVVAGGCGNGGGNDGDFDFSGTLDGRAQQVDAIVAPYAGHDTPAIAVLIGRGDRVLYQRAYGLADLDSGEAATTDQVFPLMSVSKSFTAVAILTLVDEGKIDLDDPVATYLPELERFGPELTIRRMLQHSSGLPEYYFPPLLPALLERSLFPNNADVLAVLAELGVPRFAPGDRFAYSDGNFEMLALVVERVSGQRFRDFQQSHIFDPAAMLDSFSSPNAEREATAQIVESYAKRPDGSFTRFDLFGDEAYNLYGAGDVVSNVKDMFRFHRTLVTGGVVSPDLLAEAFTPARLNDGTEPPFFPFELDSTYGLGFIIGERNGHRYVGHGGAYLGYRVYYAFFPDQDLSVMFLMAQAFDPFRNEIVLPIADVYLQDSEGNE